MSLDLTEHKSTLAQAMACCRQAIRLTRTNVDPDLCRYMATLFYNKLNLDRRKVCDINTSKSDTLLS